MTLYDLIPKGERAGNDLLLAKFLEYVEARKLELYPAQESPFSEEKKLGRNDQFTRQVSLTPGSQSVLFRS